VALGLRFGLPELCDLGTALRRGSGAATTPGAAAERRRARLPRRRGPLRADCGAREPAIRLVSV